MFVAPNEDEGTVLCEAPNLKELSAGAAGVALPPKGLAKMPLPCGLVGSFWGVGAAPNNGVEAPLAVGVALKRVLVSTGFAALAAPKRFDD